MAQLVGADPTADTAELIRCFRQSCPADPTDFLTILLLDRNVESLVETGAELLGVAVPHKNRVDRDRLLGRLADAPNSSERRVLMTRIPSLQRIVEELTRLLRSPDEVRDP